MTKKFKLQLLTEKALILLIGTMYHLTFVSKSKPKFVKKGTGNPFFELPYCPLSIYYNKAKFPQSSVRPKGYLGPHQASIIRSNHRRCYVRKGALRNFAKFTGKHLCQSLFFNKV